MTFQTGRFRCVGRTNIWKSLFSGTSQLMDLKMSPSPKTLFANVYASYSPPLVTARGPKVHDIRKFLGKKIEGGLIIHCDLVKDSLIFAAGRHGSALVSQIYGHKGAGTYLKDYLLHCSSIDTVSATRKINPSILSTFKALNGSMNLDCQASFRRQLNRVF